MSKRTFPRLALVAAMAPLFVLSSAHAGPPVDTSGGPSSGPDTGTTGAGEGGSNATVNIGGFSPPSGAQFDPNTTADPGLLDQPRTSVADKTYGPTGSGDQLGYTIVDPSVYGPQGNGQVPDYHIVQEGDTLSGICEYYYGDMYLWPKIWSFNPHVTNAHWIFPGDRIRMTDPYDRGPQGDGLRYAETYDPRDRAPQTYLLERYAFIDEDELDRSMEIEGGGDAMVMMSTLDTAYLSYSDENPPIPGERLSVYRKKRPVYDIKVKGKKQKLKKGKRIGWLVEVVGEVYIESVAEETAESTVVDSVRPIERGNRVGELKTRFVRVSGTRNEVSANGLVVDTIRDQEINGEAQFVVINLGAEDGIRRGNTLEVVQKGDAYTPDHRLHQPYDKGHPRRVLADLMVLQIEANSALAVVTYSRQEIVVGDHVEITEAGEDPEDFEAYTPRARNRTSTSGSASGGGTEAEAEGELTLGN